MKSNKNENKYNKIILGNMNDCGETITITIPKTITITTKSIIIVTKIRPRMGRRMEIVIVF